MEYTVDGHIKRAKELDTNFTIPKKKQKLEESSSQEEEINAKSILNDVPEMESVKSKYVDPYSNVMEEFRNSPIDRSKLQILVNMNEAPANTYINYKEKMGSNDTFPKELNEQLQPLFCKLCNAKLGSIVTAKYHYESPRHEKKVVQFLIDYAAATQQPVHEFVEQYNLKKRKAEEHYNPLYYHCDVCDLALSSKIHAQSHYAGKNHMKMLQGRKCPSKGHFTEEGKFIRKMENVTSSQRSDGFGADFDTPSTKEVATSLRCDLCKVSVTSLPQMQMHLDGQKHKKKLRQTGIVVESTAPTSALYASCKTPSGQFYCKQCDLCFISEKQFSAHLTSKKHLKKTNVIN